MVRIFSKAEFVKVDATFTVSIELEYLLNVVCFDYDSFYVCTHLVNKSFIYAYYDAGAVVARVRMNKLDAMAYKVLLKQFLVK